MVIYVVASVNSTVLPNLPSPNDSPNAPPQEKYADDDWWNKSIEENCILFSS